MIALRPVDEVVDWSTMVRRGEQREMKEETDNNDAFESVPLVLNYGLHDEILHVDDLFPSTERSEQTQYRLLEHYDAPL